MKRTDAYRLFAVLCLSSSIEFYGFRIELSFLKNNAFQGRKR